VIDRSGHSRLRATRRKLPFLPSGQPIHRHAA
jgi:hypothetical protein